MKMKRLFLIGFLLLVSVVLFACTDNSTDVSQEDGDSNEEEKTSNGDSEELTVFASPKPNIDIEDNKFTEHVEEKLGVKFDWTIVPNQGQAQRKQLMFASGDYTNVFLHGNHAEEGLTRVEQQRYGSQGILLPLNDLIEEHAPNVQTALEELSYLKPEITAPDGNIYALPEISTCYHCNYSQKMWINTDWLERVNLEIPTTTEELKVVLKAFSEKDANGNGDPSDEIPLTGSTDSWHGNIDGFIMNAFIYNNSEDYLFIEDGNVKLAATESEWKDGLDYLNSLNSEGLIDQGAFTQNRDALFQLGMSNQLGVVAGGFYGDFVDRADDLARNYDTIPPLVGPDGVQLSAYYGGAGEGFFAITNKATEEEQIKAIKLADYLYSKEGAIFAQYGPVGEGTLLEADEGEIGINGEQADYKPNPEVSSNDIGNLGWDQLGPRYIPGGINWVAPEDQYSLEGTELRLYNETQKYDGHEPDEVFPSGVFIPEEVSDEYNQLKTQINSYIEENMVQFITGSKDIDGDWDSYVQGLEDIGIARYLEINQEAYDNVN
ncbi:extracellular solute-binding protein [Gracilibacillus sp. YIM 98692]|uniref:extracellular solute-binding protein n=1 Tax=Gracilibacillus sp. YIM 98692 TaxID=2663532 RepID=UPI0013D2FBE3|nr:extracellular solute-binding protein [Gracilibacillus sp. YIM 98692]